ncbi:MAG: prepilin-type N-terminal cleavage/methylation domain-containing protein [Planctomycetota bacterium]|jgi:prepilin-type N-terminal cleavage/methylation domain-containing protein
MLALKNQLPARSYRSARSRRGMSLIEVMIAIGVLVVAVMSAVSSQITSMNLMTTSRESNRAMSELQSAMERVLLDLPDQIPVNYPEDTPVEFYSGLNLQNEVIVPSYPTLVAIDDIPDPLPIVLTITWRDYGARPRSLTLATMKTR